MVTSDDLLASLYGYSNTTPTPSTPVGRVQAGGTSTTRIAYGTHCAHRFGPTRWVGQHVVTVVIAWGKRPVPFRTRKLRPTAPMVLHPGGCGRVGHRRTLLQVASRPAPSRGGAWRPPPFNPPSHDVLLPILSVEETPGALDYVHGRNPKRSLDADAARNCI